MKGHCFTWLAWVYNSKLTRKTGASEVYNKSWRPNTIFKLENNDYELRDLRDAVIRQESNFITVGKRATDICLETHIKSLVRRVDEQYAWALSVLIPYRRSRTQKEEIGESSQECGECDYLVYNPSSTAVYTENISSSISQDHSNSTAITEQVSRPYRGFKISSKTNISIAISMPWGKWYGLE